MKFTIIAALVGASNAVHISHQANGYSLLKKQCDSVSNTQYLQLSKDDDITQDKAKKNIEGNHTEHYNKTAEEIDAENKKILDTQQKCMDFVQSHPGHRDICEWCQTAEVPEIIWRWNAVENVWYRYYDGEWHYWGPTKTGFSELGWTWYNGYWHHDGYVWKYENGKWYRFQGKKWVEQGLTVPVDPETPTGKEICRPFYKLEQAGYPDSLAAQEIPRCKVGKDVYMWSDEENCKFLGGKKVMQQHQTCSDGKQHEWKKVQRCVKGEDLTPDGFDYKTGQLKKTLYDFKQCELVKGDSNHIYVVAFGKCHWIPNPQVYGRIWKRNPPLTKLSQEQMDSCPKGKSISTEAQLAGWDNDHVFLLQERAMFIENRDTFNKCNLNPDSVVNTPKEEIDKMLQGDILTD